MHSRRALPTKRSQIAFARCARPGVVMIVAMELITCQASGQARRQVS